MKCHNAQKKLSAYQDRELDPKDQEQVKSHLLSCRDCREQFAELERVWKVVGQFEEIRPDPWFYRQLLRKIEEPRQQGLGPTIERFFQPLRTPAIAPILLAIGILAGAYLGNILARSDLFPFQPAQPTYSQEAFLDSLKVFDPAPPGTLAHGYLQMMSYKEDESR
ncbi:MAG TPA: zf-HC2 domain-containing protein [Thermodesulfobacteriota bacterium]|nr:zf-HC2 domain-containing protein [Thermodesulfobacteriota bacterium]